MPQFKLSLHQHAWVNTENFEVEAKDAKDAQAQADAIAKDKDIKEEYKWEVSVVEPETPDVAVTPSEPEPR